MNSFCANFSTKIFYFISVLRFDRRVEESFEPISYANGIVKELENTRAQLLGSTLPSDQEKAKNLSDHIDVLKKTISVYNARGKLDINANLPIFDAQIDNEEVLFEMFNRLDTGGNSDGKVSFDELKGFICMKGTDEDEDSKLSQILAVISKALGFRLEDFNDLLKGASIDSFGKFKRPTMPESITCLFNALDIDKDGLISSADLGGPFTLRDPSPLEDSSIGQDLLGILQGLRPLERSLNYPDFKAALQRLPRISGERVTFVQSLGLDASLARHLPPGELLDGLAGLKRGLDEDSIDRIVGIFSEEVRQRLKAELVRLRAVDTVAESQSNSKFEGFEGDFASLKEFYDGIEESLDLGSPDPNTLKGMELEHTAHPSTRRTFVTPNYLIATDLLTEWAWLRHGGPHSQAPMIQHFLDEIRRTHGNGDDGLFPGEVGDQHHEVLMIASVELPDGAAAAAAACKPDITAAPAKEELERLMTAEHPVLQTREDRARGIRVLDRAACEAHLRQLRSLHGAFPSVPAASHESLGAPSPSGRAVVVGVVLPLSPARFEAARASVEACVSECVGGARRVATLLAVPKRLAYHRHTDVPTLRQALAKLSPAELSAAASSRWGLSLPAVAAGLEGRDSAVESIVHAFIAQDLQRDFREALDAAGPCDAQLAAAMAEWGLACHEGTPRSARIDRLVAALNSEKRARQVAAWTARSCARLQGRTRFSLAELVQEHREKIGLLKLQEAEVLGLVSYTGPTFVVTNAIFRRFPRRILDLLEGDEALGPHWMPTTLFCTISGLLKLSRFTEIPAGRKVYRGLGKMLLPQNFWLPSGFPAWCGGVERAIMSTTTSKEVAMHYSGGRGTVCELELGRIHIGGQTSWLSQYPLEEELTLPPFTCLERNGEPRMERSADSEIVIFPLKVMPC